MRSRGPSNLVANQSAMAVHHSSLLMSNGSLVLRTCWRRARRGFRLGRCSASTTSMCSIATAQVRQGPLAQVWLPLLAEPLIRVYSVSYGPNARRHSFPAVPSCRVGSVELWDESGGHSYNAY